MFLQTGPVSVWSMRATSISVSIHTSPFKEQVRTEHTKKSQLINQARLGTGRPIIARERADESTTKETTKQTILSLGCRVAATDGADVAGRAFGLLGEGSGAAELGHLLGGLGEGEGRGGEGKNGQREAHFE
jgi:hypothetical protein